MTDAIVIGAGISGAAAGFELARSGLRVVLLDRYGPAAMASGWTLAGVRQSGRHPAELPLARAAIALWRIWTKRWTRRRSTAGAATFAWHAAKPRRG